MMAIETYRDFVYPWSLDHIGHMNVQFYAGRFDPEQRRATEFPLFILQAAQALLPAQA
jgi:hypothetical protein